MHAGRGCCKIQKRGDGHRLNTKRPLLRNGLHLMQSVIFLLKEQLYNLLVV